MNDLSFRVKSKLPTLTKKRFYDNTFLIANDGSTVLFICDALLAEGKRGPRLSTRRDVLEFPTEQEMLSAVVAGGWKEAPLDEDRDWRPTRAEMESP